MAYRLTKYSGNLKWQNDILYQSPLPSGGFPVNLLIQQKLVGEGTNGRVASDQLGNSIVIDNNTCAIGVDRQDFDASGGNELDSAGAVYIFARSGSTWTLQQKLVGEGTNGRNAGDRFGGSVALDGDTCVVGAYNQHFDASGGNEVSDAGAAYVFTRSGSTWTLQQKLVGEGTNGRVASDQFGWSTSISGDTCVIGARLQDYDASGANLLSNAGAAYVFTRSGSTWTLQQKLVGEGTNGRVASDQFGTSVSIDGDSCIIGAVGQGYDASGANFVSGAGAAYVYTRSGSTWTLQQKLVGEGTNGRVASDSFGWSTSISGDTCIAGANNQGYDASGANFLSAAGAAYVYTRSGSTWTLQQKLVGEGTNGRIAGDNFGTSVSINNAACIVGAQLQDYDASGANFITNAGAAYVFTRSGSTWSLQQKLVGEGTNGRNASDNFGTSVSINSNTCVIGATGQGFDAVGANEISFAGAAYVFA